MGRARAGLPGRECASSAAGDRKGSAADAPLDTLAALGKRLAPELHGRRRELAALLGMGSEERAKLRNGQALWAWMVERKLIDETALGTLVDENVGSIPAIVTQPHVRPFLDRLASLIPTPRRNRRCTGCSAVL